MRQQETKEETTTPHQSPLSSYASGRPFSQRQGTLYDASNNVKEKNRRCLYVWWTAPAGQALPRLVRLGIYSRLVPDEYKSSAPPVSSHDVAQHVRRAKHQHQRFQSLRGKKDDGGKNNHTDLAEPLELSVARLYRRFGMGTPPGCCILAVSAVFITFSTSAARSLSLVTFIGVG